jgi:hypothetical protein
MDMVRFSLSAVISGRLVSPFKLTQRLSNVMWTVERSLIHQAALYAAIGVSSIARKLPLVPLFSQASQRA